MMGSGVIGRPADIAKWLLDGKHWHGVPTDIDVGPCRAVSSGRLVLVLENEQPIARGRVYDGRLPCGLDVWCDLRTGCIRRCGFRGRRRDVSTLDAILVLRRSLSDYELLTDITGVASRQHHLEGKLCRIRKIRRLRSPPLHDQS